MSTKRALLEKLTEIAVLAGIVYGARIRCLSDTGSGYVTVSDEWKLSYDDELIVGHDSSGDALIGVDSDGATATVLDPA